ncbi:hypothetical protein CO731_04851 [Aminobacter sp. MSH1]|uniref:hypothetical protein n=1 Tax=Aminobacter sp. MSH1 TaxID=374606 RepID=UPI000D37F168|nr:hypothetical protein [Aminobacter sp. MSH1]AWC25356.1 hypothetical protein CO731_04851 [Aminobacter sp. MSH1]
MRKMVKMLLRCALTLCLVATPVLAAREDPEWNPPARFDFPYPGKMIIRYLPQPKVVEECRRISKGSIDSLTTRGCAKRLSPKVCVVVIVEETYKRATPSAVLRHERGHCNGWPGTHPD